MRFFKFLFILVVLIYQTLGAAEVEIPRTIIAIWDKKEDKDIYYTKLHQLAEMPLNHMGAKLEYYDINDPLPEINSRDDVLGVLVWFSKYYLIPDLDSYFNWACGAIDSGKRFVVMGTVGYDLVQNPKIEEFWLKIGLKDAEEWINDTHDVELIKIDKEVVEFERKYLDSKPSYMIFEKVDENVTEHLIARRGDDSSKDGILVATSDKGGFAFEGYEYFESGTLKDKQFQEWYINPFKFFQLAFNLHIKAVPDTTTLAGNRIYYSHIDGDGFNEYVEIEKYRNKNSIAAEVILEEIIKKYPHYPVTVAPIVAEIDEEWLGTKKSVEIAKKLFAEPNVEMAAHTYTHPFDWLFFENYNAADEERFQSRSIFSKMIKKLALRGHEVSDKVKDERYENPRPYMDKPFDINLEVAGAIEKINDLAPANKRVELYQWSGDCMPFEKAIKLTNDLNVRNINGGDTRFDDEYLSYSWVKPIGRTVNGLRQIYASNSNENTYTRLWKDRYWGQLFLTQTWKNTETPIRLRPLNLYYHFYSGSKIASLNTIIKLIEYIDNLEIIPITTSRYCSIADGFYTTKIVQLNENSWKILERGNLQTIRFDKATLNSVDFANSEGIIGQSHIHGSLYVYLDEEAIDPIIALNDSKEINFEPVDKIPYLIRSSWEIKNLTRAGTKISFHTMGFDDGLMVWKVPRNTQYKVVIKGADGKEKEFTIKGKFNEINFSIDSSYGKPLEVSIHEL